MLKRVLQCFEALFDLLTPHLIADLVFDELLHVADLQVLNADLLTELGEGFWDARGPPLRILTLGLVLQSSVERLHLAGDLE